MLKKKIVFPLLICLLALGGIFFYKNLQNRPYLTVIGYVQMADGLGRQTVELIDTLKDEVTISFIPTHKKRMKGMNDVPRKVKQIISKKNHQMGKVVVFEDCLWYPGHMPYKKLQAPTQDDQIRIAYSMFESSKIPPEWTIILNTYFDAVVVPDPFLIPVYQASGVKLPIFVIPLGLDLSPFLKRPLKEQANTPFTFANLSSCVDRKNQLKLIRAFAKAFGNSQDVRLILNCRAAFNKLDEAITQEIEHLGLTNVEFNIESLSNADYQALFGKIDAYINISKGEGFSIQPREAMALGIPTIVTNNTGQSTICQSGLTLSVPSRIETPAYYDWGDIYGVSYDCELSDVASAMVEMRQNYSKYLSKKEAAREWVSQYQYDTIKPLYRALIKPKKVTLGNENSVTPDGIITTSETLYQKYLRL